MDVGPRKLWGGSNAKTIRLCKSEKGAASARFALLAAPYLVPDRGGGPRLTVHYVLYARRRFTGSLGSPLTSSHQRFFAHCTAAGTHQQGFLSALTSVLWFFLLPTFYFLLSRKATSLALPNLRASSDLFSVQWYSGSVATCVQTRCPE